ncbi:succinylglutamate desuccinylase/aspartoacylase domain-containing protein [Thalassotalea euphylliae]|uniref:succinylglutamate desuccinylase/aspartoacylase domain-containing protein n=1 Tax=Thalassotalea euphylliae TaxID=1655234 RepID=UPI0015F26DC7
MLFLEGVITNNRFDKAVFIQTKAAGHKELEKLVHTISQRIANYLERRGLIQRDMENGYLNLPVDDEDSLLHLQGASVIRQDILDWMEEMTGHILDFVDAFNADNLPELPAEYQAYTYVETLTLPMDEQGERIGMVHKNVQDQDFKPLNPGDPIFTLFSGEEVCWQGDYEAYPHFINEAAYYDNNLAMSLGKKITVTL